MESTLVTLLRKLDEILVTELDNEEFAKRCIDLLPTLSDELHKVDLSRLCKKGA